MKVFVAGSTGAVGRYLVPQLVANGHEVAGMTTKHEKAEILRVLGGQLRSSPTRSIQRPSDQR